MEINLKENEFVLQQEELSEVKWYTLAEIKEMVEKYSDCIVFNEYMMNLFESVKKYNI